MNFYHIISTLFCILFVFIITIYTGNVLIQICPMSEIQEETKINYYYTLSDDNTKLIRNFNIFNQEILEEIKELIDQQYKHKLYIFKDFLCKITYISSHHTFPPKTLIFIPKNKIHWKDNIHFSIKKKIFFPESNSLIYHPDSVISFYSNSKQSIPLIIGTKVN